VRILDSLRKPQYLLHPKAFARRLRGRNDKGGVKIVSLNWGLPIEVDTRELIGWVVWCCGIFELPVMEAILRLTDPTDVFVDVGANIGLMSSVAVAAGATKIIPFEPHPQVFCRLERNISLWTQARPRIAERVIPRNEAISGQNGTSILHVPIRRYATNHGLATLEAGPNDGYRAVAEVRTTTLTRVLADLDEPVGVMKIDIEGHELTALSACKELLQAGFVRDIIFENNLGMGSAISQFFAGLGFSIFRLSCTLFRPALLESKVCNDSRFSTGATNSLATLDPARAKRRMSVRGFRCLQRQL
jgi:FkbM family methyltransferase